MSSPTLAEQVGFTEHDAQRIIQAGCDLFGSGELESAANVFRGLLALNPHDAYVHTAYGMVLQEQGDDASAARAYDSAIEEDPKMPIALLNRGILKLKRGDVSGLEDLKAIAPLKSSVGQRAREIITALALPAAL